MKTYQTTLMVLVATMLAAQPVLAAPTLIAQYSGHLVAPVPANTAGVSYNIHDYAAPANYFHLYATGYTGASPTFQICFVHTGGYTYKCVSGSGAMGSMGTGTDYVRVTLTAGADADYVLRLWRT